ncbi:MAG TPA: heavy metal-binding domain-containing protein, partial [Blastocatellia bacterium]|nr:heavy metal-binding domain-containing protein [Blastocatellia bacterium]
AIALLIISLFCVAGLCFAPASAYQKSVVYSCPMHPEVQSSKPRKCPKCGMKLEARKPPGDEQKLSQSAAPAPRTLEVVRQAEEYTCTMHPEVRTTAPGKCPKCGMALVPVTPAIAAEFNLRFECSPGAPKPNEKIRLRFSIFNPKSGEQVKEFYITHEKLFHLFIVSQDLSEFQHIHPAMQPDGSFTIETVLPAAGNYKIYSDFYPRDGAPQVLQQNLTTVGYAGDLMAARPRLAPDASLVKVVEGMKIELKLEPAEIVAGQPVALKYHLTEALTGQPIRDLVPYLGAWGHTLILSEDQEDYVHSHPEEVVPETADKSKLRGGPDATFNAFLPRPGIYRIWTQFQRGDRLTTTSFTVRAERLH